MTLKEAISEIRSIAEEYGNIPIGYTNVEQLQYWKQKLTYLQHYLVDNYQNQIAREKMFEEGNKDIVRQIAYERIKKETAGETKPISDTTALALSKGAKEYEEWNKKYAEAYGTYKAFESYMETIRNLIYAVGSHLNMLIKGNS